MSPNMTATLENSDDDIHNATLNKEDNSDVQFTPFLENIDADEYESNDTSVGIFSDDDPEEILVLVGERDVASNRNVTSTTSSNIKP